MWMWWSVDVVECVHNGIEHKIPYLRDGYLKPSSRLRCVHKTVVTCVSVCVRACVCVCVSVNKSHVFYGLALIMHLLDALVANRLGRALCGTQRLHLMMLLWVLLVRNVMAVRFVAPSGCP